MCIIACQLKDSPILPKSTLSRCWHENHDGAGYMFVANGEVVIRKPFYKLKALYNAYKRDHADYGKSSPFVLHFRWSTHGSNSPGNTHPHQINGTTTAMVHNGVLNVSVPKDRDISDTVAFVETYLRGLADETLMGREMREELERDIGFNKFVLLASDGSLSIVNEDLGEWDGSTWYSNGGYREPGSLASRVVDSWRKLAPLPVCKQKYNLPFWVREQEEEDRKWAAENREDLEEDEEWEAYLDELRAEEEQRGDLEEILEMDREYIAALREAGYPDRDAK